MRKLAVLAIVIIAIFLISGWWKGQIASLSSDKNSKLFVIPRDQSVTEVADRLQKEGFIHSSLVFKLYLRLKGMEDKIQAGRFKLSSAMTMDEIGRTISGKPVEIWVTLIEGKRVEEMAEELNAKLQVSRDKFLASAEEGYMFPDTYLFPKDVSAEQVVKVMRDNFNRHVSEDLHLKMAALGLTENQAVILASVVEREARTDQARVMVASILLKRWKIGMGLNVDSTVQYALGYQAKENPPVGGWWKRHLTKEDLKVVSPFNTYLFAGLPPKPISNPGLSSLQAVANANPNTPYLYYYHDSKGNSYYAKTLEEHNANVAENP